MKLYDVDGYDKPLRISDEHAALIGATEHVMRSKPQRTARLADWREYAIELGVEPSIAEQMTRKQIIETYGG
jgi:hypothetical protein